MTTCIYSLTGCGLSTEQPGSLDLAYREYAAAVEEGIAQDTFGKTLSEYYITLDGKNFEVKGNPKGIEASRKRVSISNRPLSRAERDVDRTSLLVMRNAFGKQSEWELSFRFSINDMVVPEGAIDLRDPKAGPEPCFITFSDEAHAGFIVIWPSVLQYYDLGPSVRLKEQWVLERKISNRALSLVLSKDREGRLEVGIDHQSFAVRMGGDRISPYNYEIPPFVRYTLFNFNDNFHEAHFSQRFDLTGGTPKEQFRQIYEGSKARDFVRFGAIYYAAMPQTFVDLIVRNIHIDTW